MAVEKVFLEILNMSFTAGFVILAVILARLLLKRAPKVFSYALWAVVLFRLVCPFSIESVLSLLPANPQPIPPDIGFAQTPQIDTGLSFIDRAVNPVLPPPTPYVSVNPMQVWTAVGTAVWLIGIAALLLYSVISLLRLKRRLRGAVPEEGNIYRMEGLETPFVLGVFRPRIYLPAGLTEREREYILLHERTHIRRFDHVVKLVGFLVLCVHWFNPLVWAAFFLCGKDMEMSCDESVIRRLGNDVKKEYSSTLLAMATGRRRVGITPLAFGEGDTRGRIKNVLNYKRPAFWVIAVVIVAVAAVCIGFAVNPRQKTYALSPEEIGQKLAAAWQEKWTTIEGHDTMLLGEGKLFVADVTGDSLPELFVAYDNYNRSGVVAYDISGREPRELGSFDATEFYHNPLVLEVYRGGGGALLHTRAVQFGPAADPRSSVQDVFAAFESGNLRVHEPVPYHIEPVETGGESLYYNSPDDGTEISKEEHERRIEEIIGGRTLAETVTVFADSPVVNLLDEAELRERVRLLAQDGNGSVTGITVSAGNPSGSSSEPAGSTEDWKQKNSVPYRLSKQENGDIQLSISNTEEFPPIPSENEGFAYWEKEKNLLHVRIITSLGQPEPGEVEGPLGSLAGAEVRFDLDLNTGALSGVEFSPGASREGPTLELEGSELRSIGNSLKHWIDLLSSTVEGEDTDAEAEMGERAFIAKLLSSFSIDGEGYARFTVPTELSQLRSAEIEAYALVPTVENGISSTKSIRLFEEEMKTSSWKPGETYRVQVNDGVLPDRSEVTLRVSFTGEDNIITNWGARQFVYRDGRPFLAVYARDSVVSIAADGRDTVLTYTESDGNQFRCRLTLPDGLTLRQGEDIEDTGTGYAGIGLFRGDQQVGGISYDMFTYYPEAVGENFYISVYGGIMLGSVVSWDDSYTPVRETDRTCNATCRIRQQEGGAGGTTSYDDGILCYDIDLLRYVAIAVDDGTLSAAQLKDFALSVKLEK